jgi:hypothetical protein
MVDGDFYWIKFQNAYSSFTPVTGGLPIYYLGSDSVTRGGQLEANAYVSHGFNVYGNATVGKATYVGSGVPSNLWVADTPLYTQGAGLTWQQQNFDLGLFEQRIGPMWNDNRAYHNQVAINPFNMLNVFLNYTVRNHTRFDQTHPGLSFNNLLNEQDVIGITSANKAVPEMVGGVSSTYLATTAAVPGDLLTLTPDAASYFPLPSALHRIAEDRPRKAEPMAHPCEANAASAMALSGRCLPGYRRTLLCISPPAGSPAGQLKLRDQLLHMRRQLRQLAAGPR